MEQARIRAVYMRGGTSKGVFFRVGDLPGDAELRDRILLRVIGSPDPYGQQIDGMGGGMSSSSKVVLVGRPALPGFDVDYSFGQVAIDKPIIDWSGNCGNLTSAVGLFAIDEGIVRPAEGDVAILRLRNTNLNARVDAHIPMTGGQVIEDGDFKLDGVAFAGAEIRLEFFDPCGSATKMFPTGNSIDVLELPELGRLQVTLIHAGGPAVFVLAEQLGLRGDEMQSEVNGDAGLLAKLETVRANAAVRMGLAATAEGATARLLHTPKLCFLSPPTGYTSSGGRPIDTGKIDLNARILSMGRLHHAIPGNCAIAIAVAAAVPGTAVSRMLGATSRSVRIGHPSGMVTVGSEVEENNGVWVVTKATLSRTARRLMQGEVFVPTALLRELETQKIAHASR